MAKTNLEVLKAIAALKPEVIDESWTDFDGYHAKVQDLLKDADLREPVKLNDAPGLYELTWDDQPMVCTHCQPVLQQLRLGDARYGELRAHSDGRRFFFTAGSLFGSQTVECRDLKAAFALMNALFASNKPLTRLPEGVYHVPPEKR